MADIRCSFCGYPNSSESDVCGICGARLKPLTGSAQPSSSASEVSASSGPVPPAGDGPDWLTDLRGKSENSGTGPEEGSQLETPAQAEPFEVPDWLARIRQRNQEEVEGQNEEDDWLANLRSPEPPQEDISPKPDEDQTQFPTGGTEKNWIAKLSDWNSPYPEESEESQLPPASSDNRPPSLLNKFLSGAVEQAPVPEENGALEPLDWMNLPGTETFLALPASEEQEDASAWLSKLPLAPVDSMSQANLPDWLNTLPENNATPAAADPYLFQPPETPEAPGFENAQEPARDSGSSEEGTPDWLKAFAADFPVEEIPQIHAVSPDPVDLLPFAGENLPNWLGENEGFEENKTEQETPSGAGTEIITPAQLPGWLEAMRPVEAVFLPHDNSTTMNEEETIEKSGPLAGLVGAIPGEDLVIKIRKPPTYSSKLQVNERQRLHASLIEEMLSDEAKPQPTRQGGRSHIPQRLGRLVIGLMLILVVLLPMVTGARHMVLPSLFPPETVSFYNIMQALPENSAVLLAVDYEPGLSGELQLAALPVVDHLAERNARIVALSTTPTGPVLAANLFQASKLGSALQVINLGYLPGGTAGLQEFARYPQMAMPYTLDGQPAWTQGILNGVNSLSKFALVIVLTDNAETARAWFEQVKPALGSVPLLFVASAQAAPLVQPYLDSGQGQGMVSGFAGGTMYSQFTKQAGPGLAYWDSYQYGMFVAILLILAGGVAHLFSSFLKRRPARKKA